MIITKKDLRLYYNTNREDICLGNDNYNLAKGYCSIKVFLFLENLAREKFGYDYKYHRLTTKILIEEFNIEVL